MQRLRRGVKVRVAGLVHRLLAPEALFPSVPVLHDHVQRDAALSILPGGLDQLELVFVPLLALHETEGPLGRDGRVAGQLAHVGDHAVKRRAVEYEKVHLIVGVAGKVAAEGVVVEGHGSRGIIQDAPTLRRTQNRAGDLQIVLVEELVAAAVVQNALLVMAKAVERLAPGEDQVQPRLESLAVYIGFADGLDARTVHAHHFLKGRVPVIAVAEDVDVPEHTPALFILPEEALSVREVR